MAHFMATVQGNRGDVSRLGSKASGMTAKVNGWGSGVAISAEHEDGQDVFHIYGTNGSGHGGSAGYIGRVIGDEFFPAGG